MGCPHMANNGRKTRQQLIAGAFAWYTSPGYPGNREPLPSELERALDDQLCPQAECVQGRKKSGRVAGMI